MQSNSKLKVRTSLGDDSSLKIKGDLSYEHILLYLSLRNNILPKRKGENWVFIFFSNFVFVLAFPTFTLILFCLLLLFSNST